MSRARPQSRLRSIFSAFVALWAVQPAIASDTSPGAAVQAEPILVEGRPTVMLGTYDLGALGYETKEYFFGGEAKSYAPRKALGADGRWDVQAQNHSPFRSRVIVARPTDPAKFNGTVVVEWFNVTGGNDTPAFWYVTHRELLRRGYAYVGVSAQSIGVEGGQAVMAPSKGLKGLNPARYASLSHPGDAFSYDIFSHAGALAKRPTANGILGNLRAKQVIAVGESQSAGFLTTYVNAIDPLDRIFDGFLVHSRFGSVAALDGVRPPAEAAQPVVRFRPDLRVPVLTLITETDLVGARLPGYFGARQPETNRLRVWEVAGTAHADNYMFGGAFTDSGALADEQVARIFRPTRTTPVGLLDKPGNPGMAHHYVAQAALAALDGWVRTRKAPKSTRPLEIAAAPTPGTGPVLSHDTNGLVRGGVRTPWVDVPTMTLSGLGNSGNFVAMLSGTAVPFDAAQLAQLYPGGATDYLRRFTQALDATIASGHLLADDRAEIIRTAQINFSAVP